MTSILRSGRLSLLIGCVACVELEKIKITIVDDTGAETGDPSNLPDDSAPPDDSPPVDSGVDSGSDSGAETGEPQEEEEEVEYPAPDTFTGPPLGQDVLIYQGDSALPVDSGAYLIDGVDGLTSIYGALGADVEIVDTWPEDPGAYRLVFWYLPGAAGGDGFEVPEETIASLFDWLGRGGRLVIAGDVDGEYGGYSLTNGNLTIDDVLDRMDVDVRVSGTVDETVACSGSLDHQLLQHGATVDSYLGNALEIGPLATWLYCDGIAIQNVWCGEIVVSGDVNPISDNPGLAPELVENLYTVPVESTCE